MPKARISKSIYTPSNRSLDQSRRSITSAVEICNNNPDFFYSISNNNSTDEIKKDYILALNSDRIIAKNHLNIDAGENLLAAASECKSLYIGALADDDFLYCQDELSEWGLSETITGYRPNMIKWESGYGIRGHSSFEISGDSPIERVDEYFKKNGGDNLTIYSFFRSDLYLPIVKFLNEFHPFKTGYYDWSISLALCAAGKILKEPGLTYVYDNRNWKGGNSDIQLSVENLFTKLGFPGALADHLRLLQAIDSYVLIKSLERIRDNSAIDKAARYAFIIYIKNYLSNLSTDDTNIATLASNLQEQRDLKSSIDSAINLICYLHPDSQDKYYNYLRAGRDIFLHDTR